MPVWKCDLKRENFQTIVVMVETDTVISRQDYFGNKTPTSDGSLMLL